MPPTIPSAQPRLTLIVIVFNMCREAPRTLYSLSTPYQRNVHAEDYEVIVVENGSTEPLPPGEVSQLGPQFRYLRIEDASPSPAAAINFAVAQANTPFIGIMIDGARMASPGVIALALQCLERFESAFVGTVGFHLGPDIQTRSPSHGYNREVEDQLLAQSDWKNNGYRLFDISALAGSSPHGWLSFIAESNLLFLSKSLFDELGGFNERFDLPGGGLVNLDFYRRACDLPSVTLITLLGEATFHQIHGGEMTNKPAEQIPIQMQRYQEQYKGIHGTLFRPSQRLPLLFGPLRSETIPWFQKTCDLYLKSRAQTSVKSQASPNQPTKAFHNELITEKQQPQAQHDRIDVLSFNLLTLLGLHEQQRLLDIGCGSLQAGRLFISYLDKGNYFRLEPNQTRLQQGVEQTIDPTIIKRKTPCFVHNDDLNLGVFNTNFDFILAQSIFSHTGPSQLRQCLASVRDVLKPNGLFLATFIELREDQYRDEWVYPGFNFFRWSTITSLCAKHGLHCRKLDWPHSLQTWLVVSSNLSHLENTSAEMGVDLLPDDTILTGFRFQAHKAGHGPGFYRHWLDKKLNTTV